jgi:hypothetical protein
MWALFVPANISVSFARSRGNYQSGTSVYGVTWQSYYTEVAISLTNLDRTDDMNELDIYVATDQLIAGAGILTGIDSCIAEATMAGTFFDATVSHKEKSGKNIDEPFFSNNMASSLYRIRCQRLSADRRLQIKFAILNRVPPPPIPNPPKEEARWAVAWISLLAGYRPVHWREQHCFSSPCNTLPQDISEVPVNIGPATWRWRNE